jgi:hypothetical protein
MKTKLFASIIIFLSAYSPLALILAIKDFDQQKNDFNNPFIIYSVLTIAVMSIVFLFLIMRYFKYGQEIEVKNISSISGELVNYTIPYMISFFGFDMSKTVDLISFVIFMTLLCILTIKTQSIFMNPILAVIGYGHYRLEYEENGIKKEAVFISGIKLKKESRYRIDRLSDYTFIVINEVN